MSTSQEQVIILHHELTCSVCYKYIYLGVCHDKDKTTDTGYPSTV